MNKPYFRFLQLASLFISGIFILSSCSVSSLTQATSLYDFAIYDRNQMTWLYSELEAGDGELRLVDSLKRRGEDSRYWGSPFSWEVDGTYFTKTSASERDLRVSLVRINPDVPAQPLTQKLAKDSIDIYASAADQEFFYTIDVFVDHLVFKKYDHDFSLLKTTEILNQGKNIAANQLLSLGDHLYLLAGIVDPSKNPVSIESEIWKLDKDFNIQETYPLPKSSGVLLRMMHDGEFFYITRPIGDSNVSNGAASHSILVYQENELEKHMDFVREIELTAAFPKELVYDEMSQCLLIFHDSHRLSHLCWTVYDLKTDQEHLLDYPDYIPGNDQVPRDPNFALHDGKCYILFKDHLEIYDVALDQRHQLDYPDEASEPFFIVFNDKESEPSGQ